MQANLGAQNHAVVLEDAEPDATLKALVATLALALALTLTLTLILTLTLTLTLTRSSRCGASATWRGSSLRRAPYMP